MDFSNLKVPNNEFYNKFIEYDTLIKIKDVQYWQWTIIIYDYIYVYFESNNNISEEILFLAQIVSQFVPWYEIREISFDLHFSGIVRLVFLYVLRGSLFLSSKEHVYLRSTKYQYSDTTHRRRVFPSIQLIWTFIHQNLTLKNLEFAFIRLQD